MSDSQMRNINPFGLRMQPELKAKIESAAKANHRSLNAEIVARLEDSIARQVEPAVLLPASAAREIAASVRRDIAVEARALVLRELAEGISNGLSHITVYLSKFDVLAEESEAADELTDAIAQELEEAGYSVLWDGPNTLTISFPA